MKYASLVAIVFLGILPLAGADLPEGPGKEIIKNHCAGCHTGNSLGGYQKPREEWEAIVTRMGQRTAATKDELTTLADYLATSFPKVDDPNKVNMNKATVKEMVERLGLPQKDAEAIVNYRERRGNFRAWGDMLVIYGVDGGKLEELQEKMSF